MSPRRRPVPVDEHQRQVEEARRLARTEGGKPDERAIQLGLTYRYAGILLATCREKISYYRKRAEKQDYTPPPGKYDANKMRVMVWTDIADQLAKQYAPDQDTSRNLVSVQDKARAALEAMPPEERYDLLASMLSLDGLDAIKERFP